jgi:flagellar basal body-associated protein FliL
MAEEDLGKIPDINFREAEEIERLVQEEEQKAEENIRQAHPLKKYFNKKLFMGLGAVMFLVWGIAWGLLSFFDENMSPPQVSTVKKEPVQASLSAGFKVQKPNIYPLKSFFVPIRNKNRETGKFLHVTAHLVLSHRKLHKDIDKVQPLIRQSVYTLLSRKDLKDFEKSSLKIEEKIKREILTTSNSFLLSGTGTITDIIFTEFVVSPS